MKINFYETGGFPLRMHVVLPYILHLRNPINKSEMTFTRPFLAGLPNAIFMPTIFHLGLHVRYRRI